MRHRVAGFKLGRSTGHRRSLLRNMATALVRHERIVTTATRAKALRPYVERLITLGKRGDLHARRLAAEHIHDHEVLQKLFGDLATRVKHRSGGYTRILKIGFRRGDTADTALIELVDRVVETPEEGEKTAAKGDKAGKAAKQAGAEGGASAKSAKKAPAKKGEAEGDEATKPKRAAKPKKAEGEGKKPRAAKKPKADDADK